ncbi:GGDEF domain-containing protein [Corallincola spongiicola]|uniref:diguanylate cyclase n=1 Tax=Corallincola spongiicola TaxID=2520508 RepID=A0ABY1WN48_9GAMM|nr:GGDEF domain-containing protein [Corallincola spongiicola]TAA44983.1 diguanylate cyclase [Corallincola spongiicola]
MKLVICWFVATFCWLLPTYGMASDMTDAFKQVRLHIAEGELADAETELEELYQQLDTDEDLQDEWLGQYYLTKAHLMFARAPSLEKPIRDVLGLAQSELTQKQATSEYADAWLLQLRLNAKHRDYDSVMAQVNEVINLAIAYEDKPLAIDALIFAADFTSESGNPLIAVEFLRRAKAITEPLNNPRLNANLDLSYARFYTGVVMTEHAVQLLTLARFFFEEKGPHSQYIETLLVLAQNYVTDSQPQKAESLFILANDFASNAKLPALKLKAALGLANLYMASGQTAKAQPFIAIGDALSSSTREKYLFTGLKAELAISNNQLIDAEKMIAQATEYLTQLPSTSRNSFEGANILKLKALLATARGDASASFEQMELYNLSILVRIREVLSGGIEALLAEMEYERVTSNNELLANRNAEFQRKLDAAEERQRLQWTVNILGIALGLILLLFFKRMVIQRKRLKELADTDGLTGLLNRRAAIAHTESWLTDLRLHEVAFAIFDIDFFKKINDAHGHQTGDRVLQQFSEVALASCRESDMLARIGGEEFLLVLPGCSLKKAEERAEKIRQAFATHTFTKNLRVTASFGVASGHNVSFEQLYDAADRALYKAKESRNCVVVDPDSPYIELKAIED